MFWDNFRFIGSTFEESVETTVNTIETGVENDPKNYFKADTLEKLAKKAGDRVILAADPSAKAWLRSFCPDRAEEFAFVEDAQTRFAALTDGRFDKVYRISGHNSYAAEVKETGCADFFYNARELFRICKRTGANPTRLKESPTDVLGIDRKESPYDGILTDDHWQIGGEAERFTICAEGREVSAVICRNPSQLKKALELSCDLIKLLV